MIQNKYITRISFLALFLTIATNILLYRYLLIEKVILKQTVAHHTQVADIYSSIIDNHPTIINKIKKK